MDFVIRLPSEWSSPSPGPYLDDVATDGVACSMGGRPNNSGTFANGLVERRRSFVNRDMVQGRVGDH